MRRCRTFGVVFATALAGALVLAGCGGGGSAGRGGASCSGKSAVPSAFKADSAATVELAVKAEGGGARVRSGDATAAVWVPAGAVKAGATWKVTPLSEAPKGVGKPLTPGIYVDTAGAAPTGECLIGFALPGVAPEGASIVKVAEDGSPATVVATTRVERDGQTILSAAVDGFSAYTTSEEDAAARDKAFVDREQANGKQVDWTIKAGGKEAQTNEGWTFNFELDLFASGGGVGQGGTYKGHSSLSLDGKYKGAPSIVKAFGKVSGIGRDANLTFEILDPSLGYLIGPDDPDRPPVDGQGTMKLDGMGSIDITAVAPNVKGHVARTEKSSGGVPFTVVIKGEDVQIEIENVGIFPGKILRTSK